MMRKETSLEADDADDYNPSPALTCIYEKDIEDGMELILNYWGWNPRRQVHCTLGYADIVCTNAIFEIKYILNRATIYQAIGQVLLYRADICPDARPIIVGQMITDLHPFLPLLKKIGIEMWQWPHNFGVA